MRFEVTFVRETYLSAFGKQVSNYSIEFSANIQNDITHNSLNLLCHIVFLEEAVELEEIIWSSRILNRP